MYIKFEPDLYDADNGFLATFYYGTKIDFLVKLPQIHDILFFQPLDPKTQILFALKCLWNPDAGLPVHSMSTLTLGKK